MPTKSDRPSWIPAHVHFVCAICGHESNELTDRGDGPICWNDIACITRALRQIPVVDGDDDDDDEWPL